MLEREIFERNCRCTHARVVEQHIESAERGFRLLEQRANGRGVGSTDMGAEKDGLRVWGAVGVGGTKMKIHKKAIQELFTSADKVLDAEDVLAIGRALA